MSMQVARAIAAKDLRTEARSRSAISTVLPFAATMLLAFGFALGPSRLLLTQVAPGLLWLAALFASVELCHRSYQHEAANGALEGLLLSPADKGAVFVGKAIAAFAELMVLMLVTTGIVILLFGLPVGAAPVLLLLTAALGIAGLSILGSLLGLLAVRIRTRQAALPVLILPLVSPVIISATKATQLLTQGTTAGVSGWLSLLVAFDAAYLAAGYLVFGHLLED
ncbi:MAG TPA: heme exporter protein CcmB [Streptosporangiaceae bacterium]